MSEPFLGEIRMLAFEFAPRGWARCDGQILPINQNQALYSLLGTTYGGDGRTTFALPDLRGRTPVHQGQGLTLGKPGGAETHSLTPLEIPSHLHALQGTSSAGTQPAPSATTLVGAGSTPLFHAQDKPAPMSPGAVSATGAGQAHDNMQPCLALNFCIALAGLFPSHN